MLFYPPLFETLLSLPHDIPSPKTSQPRVTATPAQASYRRISALSPFQRARNTSVSACRTPLWVILSARGSHRFLFSYLAPRWCLFFVFRRQGSRVFVDGLKIKSGGCMCVQRPTFRGWQAMNCWKITLANERIWNPAFVSFSCPCLSNIYPLC